MKLLIKKPWKDLKKLGKRRYALLIILSLCIGFSVGIFQIFTSIKPLFATLYEDAHRADYEYVTYGFNSTVSSEIGKIPGVKDVVPRLVFQFPIKIKDDPQTYQIRLIGINVTSEFSETNNLPIYNYDLKSGSNLQPGDDHMILLSKEFYETRNLQNSENLTIESLGNANFTIKGDFWSIEFTMTNSAPEVLFPIKGSMGIGFVDVDDLIQTINASNSELFFPYIFYQYNQLQVVFDSNVNQIDLNKVIQAKFESLGIQLISSTPFEDSYTWHYLMSDLEGSTQVFFIILILAIIMALTSNVSIYKQFISAQQKQIGILGCLGFSKKEISKSYIVLLLQITLVSTIISTVFAYMLLEGMAIEMGTGILGISLLFPFSFIPIIEALLLNLGIGFLSMVPSVYKMMKKNMVDLVYKQQGSERITHGKKNRKLKRGMKIRMRPSNKLFWKNFIRNPRNTSLMMVGITFSILIVCSMFVMWDSIQYTTNNAIRITEKWDTSVSFSIGVNDTGPEVKDTSALSGIAKEESALRLTLLFENPQINVNNQTGFLLGFNQSQTLHQFNLIDKNGKSSRLYQNNNEIIISEHISLKLKLNIGDNITIYSPSGNEKQFIIVGITKELMTTCYVLLDSAQSFSNQLGKINFIFLTYSDTLTNKSQIINDLYNISDKISVVQPMDDLINQIKIYGNLIIPFIGIVVGFAGIVEFFILFNSTQMKITEHEKEYGVLRSLGFKKRKIYGQILLENLIWTAIAIIIALLAIPLITNFMIMAYENEFSIFMHYTMLTYLGTILIPIAIIFIAARSGIKIIYKKNLYEQVQTQFIG
ncbi:MAG: FtsX-like permease family protein [Candidatus Lokiarchaeota archaeon]|nr:FtsX-like permease family protein [Candidatus Lokiarchaeota archaeon]